MVPKNLRRNRRPKVKPYVIDERFWVRHVKWEYYRLNRFLGLGLQIECHQLGAAAIEK
jgi:hypothetical protein